MHLKSLVLLLLLPVSMSFAQTSLKDINLQQGKYQVGFKHYTLTDSTRVYQIHNEYNNQQIFRPVPVSIWYPAARTSKKLPPLQVLNYLEVLKEEEEWEHLPNRFLLDWFPYLWNTPQNKAHLTEKAHAVLQANHLKGKFPVIVYAPSYQASSIENFALFEYLASHGFIIISSPSRGTDTRKLEGGTAKDMETQSRDMEFLLKEVYTLTNADTENIAFMGFSFGGISSALTAMKHTHIKALISLDGTERYNYKVLASSPYFNLEKLTVPYVHFAQKEIPEEVLKADRIPEELNYTFPLFDSLKYNRIYSYKLHNLSHSYFSSFGVLFANRDKRQDKSDALIMQSYKLVSEYTLQFLNAFLKEDALAKVYIKNTPEESGFKKELITGKYKEPIEKAFTYKDFNDLALKNKHEGIIKLYEKTVAKYPNLELKERMLNTLGLRMAFNPETAQQGINVFLLALHLYPKSANLYDSLAEAYFQNNDAKNAILNYKKSLELNPENQNAIDKLKELEE